ncbi:MAG: hypothetical protein EB059_10370 [Alphaproteobacteria bacterium]|nr:hypothetical protein [Alphaproteobacteria bacterium]
MRPSWKEAALFTWSVLWRVLIIGSVLGLLNNLLMNTMPELFTIIPPLLIVIFSLCTMIVTYMISVREALYKRGYTKIIPEKRTD